MTLGYLYSKFFKKIIRGTSVLNSKIDKTAMIYSGTTFYNSKIGRYSYVGYDSEVINCEIGAFCSIANGFIVGGAKHPMDWVSTSPAFYNVSGKIGHQLGNLSVDKTSRTVIGNDVWIGSRVIIMQGIKVANGAIIGAGAVVTKDVPPYAVVAGCPARIIKYRFDEETIKRLQESEWWQLSDKQLKEISKYINTPQLFLDKLMEINRMESLSIPSSEM